MSSRAGWLPSSSPADISPSTRAAAILAAAPTDQPLSDSRPSAGPEESLADVLTGSRHYGVTTANMTAVRSFARD